MLCMNNSNFVSMTKNGMPFDYILGGVVEGYTHSKLTG